MTRVIFENGGKKKPQEGKGTKKGGRKKRENRGSVKLVENKGKKKGTYWGGKSGEKKKAGTNAAIYTYKCKNKGVVCSHRDMPRRGGGKPRGRTWLVLKGQDGTWSSVCLTT